jgi:integrase
LKIPVSVVQIRPRAPFFAKWLKSLVFKDLCQAKASIGTRFGTPEVSPRMQLTVLYLQSSKVTGALSYRRKFSPDLRPFIPGNPRELKQSLGSTSITAPGASAAFAAAGLRYDRLVSLAAKAKAHEFDTLDTPTIAYLVESYRTQLLKTDADRRTGVSPDSWSRADRSESNEINLDHLRDDFAGSTPQASARRYSDTAQELSQGLGLNLSPGSPAFLSLCTQLHEADYRAALLIVARDDGEAIPTPEAPVAPVVLAARTAMPKTLADLIAGFQIDREVAGKWSKSMALAYAPVFRLLTAVIGTDRPLTSITRNDGRAILSAAIALPVNITKHKSLKGLSLLDAIAKGQALGLVTLAPKTVNDAYMSQASAIFKWGLLEAWLTQNPVTELRVSDPVAARDKRNPFTAGQLQILFTTGPWASNAAAPTRPVYYWAALLSLYHGFRRAEVMQLTAGDVETKAGITMIHIRGADLKNESAKRTLALHPELRRLGFLDFVAARSSEAGMSSLLFPGQGPSPNGRWGDGYGKWFLRLLRPLAFEGVKLGFHSLRHNFQDRLREAGLHGTAIAREITGRDRGGEVSDNYGSRFSDATHAATMATVCYPELDLSHLRVRPSGA